MKYRKRKKKSVRKFIRFRGDIAPYSLCTSCGDYRASNYKIDKDFSVELSPYQDRYCGSCGKKFIGNFNVYRSSLCITDIMEGVTVEKVLESV